VNTHKLQINTYDGPSLSAKQVELASETFSAEGFYKARIQANTILPRLRKPIDLHSDALDAVLYIQENDGNWDLCHRYELG
jgi:hypothetical protein